ncbi:MAG: DUF3035 domain-containing protein [Novosphingobium sp.]
MRKSADLFLVVSASAMLSACGGGGGLFNRDRPDEFAVQRQLPLVVPPDFSLTPPQPGAPRPSSGNSQSQTLDALFGGQSPRSDIEKNTTSRAGTPANGIRSAVGDPATNTVAKGEVTRDILAAPQGDGQAAQTAAGS